MQCLLFRFTRLQFETATACRYFAAVTGGANDDGAKKDQIIRHRADGSGAKLHRTDDDLQKQNRGRKPGDPFHLQRQDVGEIDNEIGIKLREGKEKRGGQHKIGKGRAEEKCGDGRPDHAEQIENGELESAPG